MAVKMSVGIAPDVTLKERLFPAKIISKTIFNHLKKQ